MEAYIVDLILIAIIVATVVISSKKGFIASVLSAVAWLVSVYLSLKLNGPISQWFYDSFLENRLTETVAGRLGENLDVSRAADYADAFVENIPATMTNAAKYIGVDINFIKGTFANAQLTQDNIVKKLVESVAEPIVISVLKFAFFFLMFIAFVIILRIVASKVSAIIKATPFKYGDSFLGGALGVVKGVLIVVLISVLLSIFAGLNEDTEAAQMIASSRIISAIAAKDFVINVFKA